MRCSPGDDATNGFFVSCFIKDQGVPRDISPGSPDIKIRKRINAAGYEQETDPERGIVPRKRKKKSHAKS